MPITGQGWEMHIVRQSVQNNGHRVRTVGTYQVFHNGVAQQGGDMKGMVAEAGGPGANAPAGNGLRVEQGRYPLATQNGEQYLTFGYRDSTDSGVHPQPGFELLSTGERREILIHPGHDFLASVGCINPCTLLEDENEPITFSSSRRRVISLIENMKSFVGSGFPNSNGQNIPRAHVVIDGEP